MALTHKPREALLAAFSAPGVTLNRTRGGFQTTSGTTIVTVRTANALEEFGLAVFDDVALPRCLTLTPAGIAEARRLQAEDPNGARP